MIINWTKFIAELLIIRIRRSRLIELIRVLLQPAIDYVADVNAAIEHLRLFSACTPQVCWLQFLLRKELNDNSITITEGNGLPVDFIVSCDNYVLESQLKGLLNRFKMAGRSYEFIFTNIEYTAQWSDPVCEKVDPLFSAQWSNPLCEVLRDILAEEYTLIIYKNGDGFPGLVPNLITCIPASPNPGGTNITLTASNGLGETFVKWIIHDGPTVTENFNSTFVLVMEYHDQLVDAIYE